MLLSTSIVIFVMSFFYICRIKCSDINMSDSNKLTKIFKLIPKIVNLMEKKSDYVSKST